MSLESMLNERRRKAMKVLILEDDVQVLSLLKLAFQRRGCEVVAFPQPEACPLNAPICPCSMHPDCPDMILSDLDMPVTSGLEFRDRLSEKKCRCKNFALMTGKSLAREEIQRIEASGTIFFFKPFELAQLYAWTDRKPSKPNNS
jgi:DNA-binding response OmpR family regulator